MTIAFRSVRETYGWMGNMAPYRVVYQGLEYKTTEHLFQCLRLQHVLVAFDEVRSQKSPMAAKMKSKKYRDLISTTPEQDLDNMLLCLQLKLEQHPELQGALLDTEDEDIVEDCTARPHGSGLYWGAQLVNGKWEGKNILGHCWMLKREELKKRREENDKHNVR